MTQPTELITRMGFELDESQKKRVVRAFTDLRKAAKDGLDDKAVEQYGKRFGRLAKDIGLPESALESLSNELLEMGANLSQIKKFGDAFLEMGNNAKRAGREINQISKVQLRQQRFDEVSKDVALAGDVQSNLGALNALSGGQLGGLGEVVALAEELPRLKTAIAGLPDVVANAAATLGPAGIAIGVALAAVALAVGDLVSRAQRESEQLQKAFQAQLDLETRLNSGDFSAEELESELEAAQGAYNAAVDQLAEAQQEAARQFQAIQDDVPALGVFADGVARAVFTISDAFNTGSVDAAQENIRVAEEARDKAWATIQALASARDDERLVSEEATAAEEELARAREASANAAQQIAQLEQQAVQARERYDQASEDRMVDSFNRQLDEQQDYNDAAIKRREQLSKQLIGIQAAANKRIAALQEDLNKLPLERAKELADAEKSAADQRREVLEDYARDSLKDAEDFNRDISRLEKKGQKERARIIEDAQKTINEAVGSLDAKAVLEAEAERDTALKRSVEDQNETVQEQTESFLVERERQRQALQARLADIQSSLQQEQQAIRESYSQRREELRVALEEENAALIAAKKEATAAYLQREQEIEAERQKQQARRQRDEEIAERRRQRDLQQELQAIQLRAKAILSEVQATRALEAAASRLAATIANLSFGSVGSGSRSSGSLASRKTGISTKRIGSGRGGNTISAFASGGIVTSPQLAYVGEGGKPEAIIPFERGEGLGAALRRYGVDGGGGSSVGNIVINLNGDVLSTDFVTRPEVLGGFRKMGEHIQIQVIEAIKEARRGKKVS